MRSKTQKTKVIAKVPYLYPQKAWLEPIARITDFEIIMEINEIRARTLGGKG